MAKAISRERYERDILIAAKLGMGRGIAGAVDGLDCDQGPAARLNRWLKARVPGFGNASPKEKAKGYWRDADADVQPPADLSTPEARVWAYITNTSSAHTKRAYGAALRRAVDLMGLDSLGDLLSIEVAHVARYKAELQARGLSGGTISRQLSCVRTLLDREIRLGFRQAPNPADAMLVKPPKGEARSTLDTLTPEEVQAVLRPCDEGEHVRHVRDAALLRVAFWCGLRVGEMAGMTAARPEDWAHVREGAHFAHEDGRLVLYVVGKGEKARTMPVGDELAGKLQAYLEATGRDWSDTGPLWRPTKGRPSEELDTRSIRRLVQSRCKQAGIRKRISTHSTRKTAATRLLALGVDIEKVRHFMGHTSIMTTQRYFNANGHGEHPASRINYDA